MYSLIWAVMSRCGIAKARAIGFTAALYSIGLPPEIRGLNILDEDDLQFVKEVYVNFEDDVRDALRYFNPSLQSLLPKELETIVRDFPIDFDTDEGHKEITDYVVDSIRKNKTGGLGEYVLRAANCRRFLG